MIQVSIIIVNYNTAKCVDECIASILQETHEISYEIILIDNHSSQRDIEDISLKYPSLQFIQNPKNIGFAAACNQAVQKAVGDFLFFLNPDTILKNNALKLFYDFWQVYFKQYKISCLGAPLQNSMGETIHSFEDFPDMADYLFVKLKSIGSRILGMQYNLPIKVVPKEFDFFSVDYVTGADLFISKANFLAVNGFDDDYFLYFEETDLQLRLSHLGYQSYLLQTPQIQHLKGASTHQQQSLLRVLYFDSLLLYFKKNSFTFLYYPFQLLWSVLDFPTFVQKLMLNNKHKLN